MCVYIVLLLLLIQGNDHIFLHHRHSDAIQLCQRFDYVRILS